MPTGRIVDPVFGTLTWNRKQLCWYGETTLTHGPPIALYVQSLGYITQLPPFEDASWDRTITLASREALRRVRRSYRSARAAVADEYLPIFPRWNEGKKIGRTTFLRRLHVESVTMLPDGEAELFFNDDGMFGGHALIVHLDPEGVARRVELFG